VLVPVSTSGAGTHFGSEKARKARKARPIVIVNVTNPIARRATIIA